MKNALLILTMTLAAGVFAFAQNDKQIDALEQKIRRLDIAAAEAILRKDFDALDRLCAGDFMTNSPRNEIVKGRAALKELFRRGVIDYASFVREIELVSIYGETAIVMGRETIITKAGARQARRYTNIWVKRGGRWLLTARHASLVFPN